MIVLLDMDGPSVKFHEKFYETYPDLFTVRFPGAKSWNDVLEQWPKGEYYLHKLLGLTQKQFNDLIREPEFWRTMEPTPWFDRLVAKIKSLDCSLCFCSKPVTTVDGKVNWLRDRFGENYIDWHFTHHKWMLAKPSVVLIDDCDEELYAFRKQGGKGICFPRLWNSMHKYHDVAYQYIETSLDITVK